MMTQSSAGPEDRPLTPQDSLALINKQQSSGVRRRQLASALLCGVWGFAYVISWGAFYLAREQVLPVLVAAILTGVLIIGSIAFSAWFGVHSSQGVRGPSQLTGAMYGWSWTLGSFALVAINVGLQHKGLTDDQTTLLWSGTALLFAGLLYLAGGAIFRSWPHYTIGAWTLIVAAVSVYVGVPDNYLVLSLAGGGGFLAQAAFYLWRSAHPSNPGRAEVGPVGQGAQAL
jgi:hypothetical protein